MDEQTYLDHLQELWQKNRPCERGSPSRFYQIEARVSITAGRNITTVVSGEYGHLQSPANSLHRRISLNHHREGEERRTEKNEFPLDSMSRS